MAPRSTAGPNLPNLAPTVDRFLAGIRPRGPACPVRPPLLPDAEHIEYERVDERTRWAQAPLPNPGGPAPAHSLTVSRPRFTSPSADHVHSRPPLNELGAAPALRRASVRSRPFNASDGVQHASIPPIPDPVALRPRPELLGTSPPARINGVFGRPRDAQDRHLSEIRCLDPENDLILTVFIELTEYLIVINMSSSMNETI